MYADSHELKRMQRRVERRVRGEMLFRLHRILALFCVGVAVSAWLLSPWRYYSGGGSVLVVLFFVSTMVIHTLLRRLNHTAEQLRETEMQLELQRAGYGEIEKRKREAAMVAHLSDDGELVYSDDDPQQTSTAGSYN